MKRKAGEVAGNLKKKAATAAVNVAFAGDAAKEKVKSTAATVKKRVTDAPKVAKRSIKDRIKKGALAVAKRMSEEKQDLQELPIIPVAAGAALAAAPMIAKKLLKPGVDKALDKATQTNKMPLATGGNQQDLRKALQKLRNSHEPEGDLIDEKFGMAADPSKPQSPRPTKMPKSRERNIGKHDDYKDNPNRDFGVRPEKGQKLRSRASAVVQSQRRTDKEVGVREQSELEEGKKKMPYVKMFRKAGNLGRDGSPEAMERSKKITGVMNKNAERVAAHRERDDAAKDAKAARKAKMKEELSIDQQMKISRDAAKDRNPNPDHKAIRAKMLKKPLPKDTRTDAQKMTDATGPRPGSRYRGD